MLNLKETQIIQKLDLSLDINVVKNKNFNDYDKKKLAN